MQLLSDISGNFGVFCFLFAYYLLQKARITYSSASYLLLNLAGSLLLIVSLLINWNLSAFLLEVAWALISIYGIYKHVYIPWRSKNHEQR